MSSEVRKVPLECCFIQRPMGVVLMLLSPQLEFAGRQKVRIEGQDRQLGVALGVWGPNSSGRLIGRSTSGECWLCGTGAPSTLVSMLDPSFRRFATQARIAPRRSRGTVWPDWRKEQARNEVESSVEIGAESTTAADLRSAKTRESDSSSSNITWDLTNLEQPTSLKAATKVLEI